MKSRWLSAALMAAGLGVGTANGQQPAYMPTPVGAARIPEPYPISEQQPPMMQGPLNSYTLPPGPSDALALPAGHSSAFQCEEFVREKACFFHVGAWGLQRQDVGNKLMALQDTVGLDTGIPVTNGTTLADFHDIHQHVQWGGTATLGYLCDSSAFEVTGKYLSSGNIGANYAAPGQIDGFFTNPPPGFGGDNGLWLQADTMSFQLQTTLASGEANYHYTSPAVTEAELIIGIRYVNFWERLDVNTDDDGLTAGPDPTNVARYRVETRNQIVGPQIGFEYDTYVLPSLLKGTLSVGVTAKAMVGADFTSTNHSLTRGDGLVGFSSQQSNSPILSEVYEANAFIESHITEKCRIRAGYDFLFMSGIKLSQDQFDFNLANPPGQTNNHGSVYFQGPTLELQLLF